jgi:type I restriction enzyme, S subunit
MNQLAKARTYKSVECVVFRIAANRFGGLSNMSSDYPLEINGTRVWSSEALYQACRFPLRPDLQRLIVAERSPMTAKMKAKHFLPKSRHDWESVRIKIMRWCLRVKLAQNWSRFGNLLLSTGNRPIVEESTRDKFWAAKQTKPGELVGINAMGRLLMELREQLTGCGRDRLSVVEPLNLCDFLFFGEQVGIIRRSEMSGSPQATVQFSISEQWKYQI